MKELLTVLDAVATESNGIKLGTPWKRTDSSLGAVIPILSEASTPRDYTMLQEAEKAGKASTEDTGSISGVKIKNTGEKPIFVRSSSIFKGNTQERAATISVVVEPEETRDIEVKCVHASKGITPGAKMQYSGHVAPHMMAMSLSRGDQHAVWSSVRSYSASMASSGNQFAAVQSDNLVGSLDYAKEKGSFDKALGKIECLANQIGAIIFDNEGIVGLEIFDHPDSWKAFHESVLKSYADVLTKESKSKGYKLDLDGLKNELNEFIQKCKRCSVKLASETRHSQTYIVSNGDVFGEYSMISNKIMHTLLLVKRADDGDSIPLSQPRTTANIYPSNQFQPLTPSPTPPTIPSIYPYDHEHNCPHRRKEINPWHIGDPSYTPLRIGDPPYRPLHIGDPPYRRHWPYGEPPRRMPRISYQSSANFTATTAKMGARSIINVPKDVAGHFSSGTRVQVTYLGKKKTS